MNTNRGFASVLILLCLTSCLIVLAKPVSGASAVDNSWVEKAPMPTARSGLGVAVVNDRIYAIGGTTYEYSMRPSFPSALLPVETTGNGGGVVGTNEEYNPTTNTWVSKTPMPTPREEFAIAVYQNMIYCIGGSTGNDTVGVNEVYYPENDSWSTKARIPTPEANIQANVVNGKIYVIGDSVNYVYEPATDNWTTMMFMPNSGRFTTSSVLYGKIYIVGSNMTQVYDHLNDSWSTGEPFPEILDGNATSVATTGADAFARIYVYNENFSEVWDNTTHAEVLIAETTVEAYNPEKNSWTSGSDLPSNRYSFAVTVLEDSFYVVGGCNAIIYTTANWVPGTLTEVATNEQYFPFGYGTVPPVISVVSPKKTNFDSSEVSLNFTINKPAYWIGYSLDGKQNVTVAGNATLTGLFRGLHNVTLYTNDTFGNMVASSTITFTVGTPFPTVPVIAVFKRNSSCCDCWFVGLFQETQKREKFTFNEEHRKKVLEKRIRLNN